MKSKHKQINFISFHALNENLLHTKKQTMENIVLLYRVRSDFTTLRYATIK